MTKIISMQDIRVSLAKIADEAERGERFIVVRNSKPVFQLAPLSDARQSPPVQRMTLGELRATFDANPAEKWGITPSEVDEIIHKVHGEIPHEAGNPPHA
ncbi:MAG TPA: hypothetical protein PKE55_04545 [Kiritimatiellia bacterium]|nr:hypothetical protein [Kiritimatiellia bacterium]